MIATVKGAEPTSDTLRVLDTRTWLLDVATDLSEIVGAPSAMTSIQRATEKGNVGPEL